MTMLSTLGHFRPAAALSEADSFSTDQGTRANQNSWLHVLSHLHPKYGGLSAVVPQLSSAVAETDRYAIQLAAFCQTGEEHVPQTDPSVAVVHLPFVLSKKQGFGGSQDLASMVDASSGVHVHGLWQRSTALAAATARKKRKPYVISAHGMLEPWALANKRWKKKLYLALVEKANLQGAACLHALTRAEAQDYRRLGLRNPIAIIPNGVVIPSQNSAADFFERFPSLAGKRIILFLGRIHFKKGLDILCKAWSQVAGKWPDAQLVLAGPDFEGTLESVQRLAKRLNLEKRITFTGMLSGASKWSAVDAADLFVLPSYSEGLSVSTLEAMGAGKPVIITENCHLPEAAQMGAGIEIPARVEPLVDALTDMLRKSPAELARMGDCGKHLIRARYSWQAIGQQMADLYRWIEGGPKSNQVELDEVGSC